MNCDLANAFRNFHHTWRAYRREIEETAMLRRAKNEDRRWKFFHLAGMPAEICGGGADVDPEVILSTIMEEYPGQRDHVRKAILGDHPVQRGDVYQGIRFLAVCVG